MHKRITNPFSDESNTLLETIPGIEIKTQVVIDKNKNDKYSREFLVMSTGVIYVRPIYYSQNENDKWRYLHDDSLIAGLSGDYIYLLNNFKNACLDSTNRHLEIYNHLFKNADKNYLIIKKAINNFSHEMARHYNKIGIKAFYGNENFEPWV